MGVSGGKRNPSLEASQIIQAKDDSVLDQNGSSKAGKKKKWLYSGHILKEELVGFEDQLFMGHKKRIVKGHSKVFGEQKLAEQSCYLLKREN